MTNKLFVGGISWGTTESDLRDFFAQVGTVSSVSIITDRETGQSKGFGFVEMETETLAQEAIQKLNGKMLGDRNLTINEARPQVSRDDNFRQSNRRKGGYDRENRGRRY